MDTKATVNVGEFSRGGEARSAQAPAALDHDMNVKEKLVPAGILNLTGHALDISFGISAKTSDFVVDCLEQWWDRQGEIRNKINKLLIMSDNGPEMSSSRTQMMYRMVEFSKKTGLTIHLLYYPPYHSKYNPLERCWGFLEKHWSGTLLDSVEKTLRWAGTLVWKGIRPFVNLVDKIYEKGVKLSKAEMRKVEAKLQRHPMLKKWDVLISPN